MITKSRLIELFLQVDRSEQWENLLMVRPMWSTESIDAAIDRALDKR